MHIEDQEQRTRAVDPTQSFIVQAPAGSGKTELLTQRFLRLLACVAQPESIIALTFTRKAAFEMRERIMAALQFAKEAKAPTSAHQLTTWQLARKALQQSQSQDWDILQNPNRLRVLTLDAWCSYLAEKMPLMSKFGTSPNVTPDAETLYEMAAERVLDQLKGNSAWCDALCNILLHLDNNHERVVRLIINMLQTREQWLGNIYQAKNREDQRKHGEASLTNLVETSIRKIHSHLPEALTIELLELASFAAEQLATSNSSSKLTSWMSCQSFPKPTIEYIEQWQGLGEMLLTKQSQWRKRVDKTVGFPAASSTSDKQQQAIIKLNKQRMIDMLELLSDLDSLKHHFAAITHCPELEYSDAQWETVESLLEILPLCVAELQLVFREKQTVDFIEVTQRALNALGNLQMPSDLTLHLDSVVQHILVDEFQDTSHTQFHLLECLTAGWEAGDGRSLFLVGDPMQSIYRFRQAEVGLFLHAEQCGIGCLSLEKIQLSSNFRSSTGIVEWLNVTFPTVFPKLADSMLGAIPYHKAQAVIPNRYDNAVYYHPAEDSSAEAEQVAHCIQAAQKRNPGGSIAILVKARTHLTDILPALQRAQIPYQALELDSLFWRPVVQDLWSLTRALHHLGDRLAWLAILRAPWCGLSLTALHSMLFQDREACVWQQIQSADCSALTKSESERLQQFIVIMKKSQQKRLQGTLREWVESTWLAFSGPACVMHESELDEARSFFTLLEAHDENGQLADFTQFERRLQRLYASPPDAGENAIQVMTIHKAKGLEFDSVIVPGLSRRTAADSPSLLLWHNDWQSDSKDLLLAPIKASDQEQDELYRFLHRQNKERAEFEKARLLYVALTRAKHELYLCYTLDTNSKGDVRTPSPGSALGLLWSSLDTKLNQTPHASRYTPETKTQITMRYLDTAKDNGKYIQVDMPAPKRLFPSWQEPSRSIVGTFCHRVLCSIAEDGYLQWPLDKIQLMKSAWRQGLLQLGMTQTTVDDALLVVTEAISNTLTDKRGQWILSDHRQAKNEYPISLYEQEELKHYVLDRTFVDDEGTRWIIDYKISEPDDLSIDDFMKQQRHRYKAQLNHYAHLFHLIEKRRVKLGLYFPLITKFESWKYKAPVADNQ